VSGVSWQNQSCANRRSSQRTSPTTPITGRNQQSGRTDRNAFSSTVVCVAPSELPKHEAVTQSSRPTWTTGRLGRRRSIHRLRGQPVGAWMSLGGAFLGNPCLPKVDSVFPRRNSGVDMGGGDAVGSLCSCSTKVYGCRRHATGTPQYS